MKFYISNFYQIRNMTPNMLPVSTAMWDPKWFHLGDGHSKYIDKNGVINGVKFPELVLDKYRWDDLAKKHLSCIDLCKDSCYMEFSIEYCPFMKEYYKNITTKMESFEKFLQHCESYVQYMRQSTGISIDTIVLIVYESVEKPCGERWVLKDWFAENGYELKEWRK